MSKISREAVENPNDGFFERYVKMADEAKIRQEEMSDAAKEYHNPTAQKAARWAWCLRDIEALERIFLHEGQDLDDIVRNAISDYL